MTEYIAYYRVSTAQQGRSGLGLDAQKEAVYSYARNTPVVEEFTEIESGKKNNRPELLKALELCRKKKAVLIIAKLDRLGRNVAFIASLMESKVDFICCDNPTANKLMLHMLSAFAEFEREQISIRTKAALKQAKNRGVIFGRNGHKLAVLNKQKAMDFALSMKPIITELQNQDFTTIQQLTDELNHRNIHSPQNGKWYLSSVHKLLKRIETNF